MMDGHPAEPRDFTGVVVIGRNEGDRLVTCLRSLQQSGVRVVYVDSSSTDDSVARAAALGADTVNLDTRTPFTAGRARNTGFSRLIEIAPGLRYVQFVDGDCSVADTWLDQSLRFLTARPEVAIVCGRRKEKFPQHSLYNRLCDIEWDTPIGEAEACGGDFLVRTEAFEAVGGFNPSLIAGEEPELCYRLRSGGWRIERINAAMTYHDASMTRFSQWVRRCSRAGYAYAARAALHWRDNSRYCWRENVRVMLWACVIPSAILLSSVLISPWLLFGFLIYALQFARVKRDFEARKIEGEPAIYSLFVLLGKWPEFYGQMLFLSRRLLRKDQRIIEYK
jgi:GT2 family glycosyltransferase